MYIESYAYTYMSYVRPLSSSTDLEFFKNAFLHSPLMCLYVLPRYKSSSVLYTRL